MDEEKREWWTVAAYRGKNLRWTKRYPDSFQGETIYRSTIEHVKETGFDWIRLQHVSVTPSQAPDMKIIEEWEPESAYLSP